MKKFVSWKMVAAWIIAFFVGLYSTFVALRLWGWFAVPILHLPDLSFLQLWGLMLLASTLMRGSFQTSTNGESGKWATLGTAVEMCIPDEKQQQWKDYWDGEPLRVLLETVGAIVGAFAVNTLVLFIGFILHVATA
ncbi:MAG: hypothetical protein WCE75_16320 [Terracidiphilus sp.]